ncbi:phosphoadenosine phosphosulfate reductase family protein [Phenylobacterium aquaticum]|uniref:phosphoadenosine phosphosulfate reductase domain-containing protein n=1 Tax=Phenylobacterium aquaticum TaxID=1763816 RepID=UPI001F5CEFC3|nr:phosphoadenosine phosphosulfate reductase family protein [Phenylobacterium aquaticum]MCI3130968.1 phosphoadenosine phosphosulfate reductase family protein [Phenylobacterium aquaticum]
MSPLDPGGYDRVVVAFSGGKDSLAALLHLLDLGVRIERIELHHHEVDGPSDTYMDWPITPAYVAAVAAHLGLPLYRSWREGGFRREMDRDGTPTAPVLFDTPDGRLGRAGGAGPAGVRGRFPQVSADLSVRWCSPALKIDVLAAAIRGQARFETGCTLVVTGERAEESPARARYRPFERHRTSCGRRTVDHWRPLLAWNEASVWARIGAAALRPHPAYSLGWSRLSCRCCIFGSPAQWATIRALYPAAFAVIADREARTGRTIQHRASVVALADRALPYPAALAQLELAAMAAGREWTLPVIEPNWSLPAGAFGEAAGPT